MDNQAIKLLAEGIDATPFEIPGASGEFRIQILNQDTARGVVTTIVHLPAGGTIPAHFHEAGSEMHYVLEGDMTEAGESFGPGAFLTHAAGAVHGPHGSQGGARVLTVQQWQSTGGAFDFHPAEQDGVAAGGTSADRASSEPAPSEPTTSGQASPDQAGERGEAKGYA